MEQCTEIGERRAAGNSREKEPTSRLLDGNTDAGSRHRGSGDAGRGGDSLGTSCASSDHHHDDEAQAAADHHDHEDQAGADHDDHYQTEATAASSPVNHGAVQLVLTLGGLTSYGANTDMGETVELSSAGAGEILKLHSAYNKAEGIEGTAMSGHRCAGCQHPGHPARPGSQSIVTGGVDYTRPYGTGLWTATKVPVPNQAFSRPATAPEPHRDQPHHHHQCHEDGHDLSRQLHDQ